MRRRLFALTFMFAALAVARAQRPVIEKIDPPNWFNAVDHPLFLLVKGDNLAGLEWRVSDAQLHIISQKSSANGHWAMLWLSGAPAHAEQVQLHARGLAGEVSAPYSFTARKPASAGFAGFFPADTLYLIMTDRFADGNLANDGPDAQASARSRVAAAEREKPRGWHGGDLRGITEHLSYIQELGATTVWITPVYANVGESMSYHGYGATDMYAVDPHYGSIADLQQLASAAHARGMKLALDTVPNHVGLAHPWVQDEPEPDWFHGTLAHHTKASGNFEALLDPHAPWRDQQPALDGWFADALPDMNEGNPDVAQYLVQNAIWWIETAGLDALRIDTFPYVERPFWADFHAQIRALYPRLTDVGEIFYRDPAVTSYFAGGAAHAGVGGVVDTGLYTPFDFPTYFALRDTLLGSAPMSELARVWGQDRLYPHPERLVPFLGNHDTARFLSSGEGASPERLRLAFGILATMRGTPQIYAGDEIAMRGGEDPDNRHDFPGGFPQREDDEDAHPVAPAILTMPGYPSDPVDRRTAAPSMARVNSAFLPATRTGEQQATWRYLAAMLHLRTQHPAIAKGVQQDLFADDTAIAYLRIAGAEAGPCAADASEHVLVIANKAAYQREVSFTTQDTALAGCASFEGLGPGPGAEAAVSSGKFTVQMPAESTLVWVAR